MEFTFAEQLGFRGLTLLTFLPVIGALVMLLFMRGKASAYKATALVTSLATFALSIYMAIVFNTDTATFQFQENFVWIDSFGINYHMGVDGISMLLVMLTSFLSVIAILGSWNYAKDRELAFFISLLALETGMIGVFTSMDLFLFYVFWEIQLIPMYFLIGVWGGERRIYAAIKFFLYTFAGSVLMLVAIIALYFHHYAVTGVYTMDLMKLYELPIPVKLQGWLFAAFFLAFAFKVPMFPFHTWL